MFSTKWCLLLSAVAVAMTIGVAGCPSTPPETAVLAGTWALDASSNPNPNLTEVLLNFDSDGNLVSVTRTFDNATATTTLTDTTTSVSGLNVTISSTTAGFTLSFAGQLNGTNTVITGNASLTVVIGNTTITAPTGPATLTKE